MTLAPIVLHIVLACAGAVVAVRGRAGRKLRLLPIYLGFVAIAGATGATVLLLGSPGAYRWVFWAIELAHNLLLCGLALEIVTAVLPRRFIEPWSTVFVGFLVVSIARNWPDTSTAALLNLTISASCTAGLLLIALVFVNEVDWPQGYAVAAAGLAAVLAGNLLSSVGWIQGHLWPLALQIGDVPGLVLLATVGLPYHGRSERYASGGKVKARVCNAD